MSTRFVHLHLHTEYSIVDSVVRVNSLMEAVAKAGMPAVAVTDQGNLFAMVKFYRAALREGLKPIVGAEVWLRDERSASGPSTQRDRRRTEAELDCVLFEQAFDVDLEMQLAHATQAQLPALGVHRRVKGGVFTSESPESSTELIPPSASDPCRTLDDRLGYLGCDGD